MVTMRFEKPNNCYECEIRRTIGCYIGNANGWLTTKKDDNCPVIDEDGKN